MKIDDKDLIQFMTAFGSFVLGKYYIAHKKGEDNDR